MWRLKVPMHHFLLQGFAIVHVLCEPEAQRGKCWPRCLHVFVDENKLFYDPYTLKPGPS
jgi:hypothetical protein